MRKTAASIIVLCALAACASTPWWSKVASTLGDASFSGSTSGAVTNFSIYNVTLPPGDHDVITITGWYGQTSTYYPYLGGNPVLFYTPNAVQWSNPDLLGGAWACGVAGGTNLVSSFSFNGFPFVAYTNHPTVAETWPYGVYTVAGWSSNAVTLNLGGTDFAFGPGAFNRNCIAGGSGDCILTGSGLVSVGISRTPCQRFYQARSCRNDNNMADVDGSISITNGTSFFAIRISANGTNHVFDTVTRYQAGGWFNYSSSFPCPDRFSSKGIYQFYMFSIFNAFNHKNETWFDHRVFTTRLSDEQLERIYQNGKDEVIRRGL